jgi:outer membrane protein assembly factor BamB
MIASAYVARCLILAALLCLAPFSGPLLAQSAIRTVVLGEQQNTASVSETFDTDKSVQLVFRIGSLPQNAKVTGATLQLVAVDFQNIQSTVAIEVFVRPGDGPQTLFDSVEFGKREPVEVEDARRKTRPALWRAEDDSPWFTMVRGGVQNTITLIIGPKEADKGKMTRLWYSAKADESADRPRLILEYTVWGMKEPTQTVGLVGVQGTQAFVPVMDVQTKLNEEVYVRRFPAEMTSQTPAFGHGLVYLVTGTNQNTAVEARMPVSGELVWSESVAGAGPHILLAPSNRLYVVGNEWIVTFLIDPQKPRAKPKAPHVKKVLGLKPEHPPAPGRDGSLYIFNLDRLIALNPDLEEMWSVSLKKPIGPITVDPSGRYVYLISAADGLLAFDAQTGKKYAVELSNQQKLKSRGDPGDLHAPVVVKLDDAKIGVTENVFVATSTGDGGSMTLIRNGMMRKVEPSKTLERADPPRDGLWSQVLPHPAAGWPKPFEDGAIFGISSRQSTTTGRLVPLDPRGSDDKDERPEITVANAIWETPGRPVVDASGAIHIWNGQEAYRIRNVLTGATVDLKFPGIVRSSKARLMFGSDGTLYAHNPNDGSLYVVEPRVVLYGTRVARARAPMNLVVQGQGGVNTGIAAHGTIEFLPGTTLAAETTVLPGER